MLQEFIEQNYLIIEQNIVTNTVVWNGDTTQWSPPQGSIALVQATTPAKIWVPNSDTPPVYVLTEVLGASAIGFIWDGTYLTTNEPRPTIPSTIETPAANQPATSGTTTI